MKCLEKEIVTDSEGLAMKAVVLDVNSKEKVMRRVDKFRKSTEWWCAGTELVCDGVAKQGLAAV